ncbi:MAG: hypothetical protein ACXWX0_10005 [Actinomycetota bacterium]
MNARSFSGTVSTALVTLVVLAVLAPAVGAQTYPPSAPTVGVSDSTVCARQQITVSGDNWQSDSKVRLFLRPRFGSLGKDRVDSDGSFSRTVRIPRNLRPGEYQIIAFGRDEDGDRVRVATSITVRSRCSAVAGDTVGDTVAGTEVVNASDGSASTGGNIQPWLVLALSLAGVGIVMLAAGVLLRRSRVWSR